MCMDLDIMNLHLPINRDTMGPSMVDGDAEYAYGAWGPYTNSIDCIIQFVKSHNIVDYKSICDDQNKSHWIIIQSTDTCHIAQGPFRFNEDVMVMNEDDRVIGVTLGKEKRLVSIRGLGMPCIDFVATGQFWVISKPHDFIQGQSFSASPTILLDCNVAKGEANIDPTIDSSILDARQDVSQVVQGIEGDGGSRRLEESDFLFETWTNKELVELKAHYLVDLEISDDAYLKVTHGGERLAPWMPTIGLEDGHGNCMELNRAHLQVAESQPLEPLPNDLDMPFEEDDIYSMFADLLKNDEAIELRANDLVDFCDEDVGSQAIVLSTNDKSVDMSITIEDNINVGGGFSSNVQVHGEEVVLDNFALIGENRTHFHVGQSSCEMEGQKMAQKMIFSHSNVGDNNNPMKKRPLMDEQRRFLPKVSNDMTERVFTFRPIVDGGANGVGEARQKKARHTTKSPSLLSVLLGKTSSRPNEVHTLLTKKNSSKGKDGLAPPMLGDFMHILKDGSLQILLDNEASLTTEFHRISPLKNVEGISKDGKMNGQMLGETVNTNYGGRKPFKRNPKPPKFNHHGVIRQGGGKESFVAYFRPKNLLDSNKTFVTIGEFPNEMHAWDAFNLFAFVHEGEDSCINMVDNDSIEIDAAVWGELPRVDLLAHLRLKGRGYFQSDVLPSDSFIPRFRNIKFRKNTRGIEKGKIRWFCDVLLCEGVTDPNVENGTKITSTYETAEEAAKEADRLVILNEGPTAWTNYTLTDYMTEVQKEQWDPIWIPLQDNPKKYLSTKKYNSLS